LILAAGLLGACSPPPLGVEGPASEGLVFVRLIGSSSELMRARLSDGEVGALTGTPDREESWPYWSHPARRLVFQVSPALVGKSSDLMLWDPDAGETPLFETPERDERWPAWSPRGRRLAFAFRSRGPAPTAPAGRARREPKKSQGGAGGQRAGGESAAAGVATVDLEGGELAVLARSGPRDFFFRPSFAPDGERLVVQRRGGSGRGSDLWILSRQAPPRPLTRDPAWFDMKPWFTRDGTRVVYSRRRADGGPRDIESVTVEGGDRRVIASTPRSDDHSARPSPTRDEIAFVSDRDGASQLFLADLSGSAVRKLTDSPERNHVAPRWSPDGERLVVTLSPAEGAEPRLVDQSSLEGAGILVVDRRGEVIFETSGFMPDWMPPWR
jgi:Tol biopolymer transport system component